MMKLSFRAFHLFTGTRAILNQFLVYLGILLTLLKLIYKPEITFLKSEADSN